MIRTPAANKQEYQSRNIERLGMLAHLAGLSTGDRDYLYMYLHEQIPTLYTREWVDRILDEAAADWKEIVDN